jgi:iron complex outermembrane receptor protein/hemoglobin/transferrin/lactoferrin receptor protein
MTARVAATSAAAVVIVSLSIAGAQSEVVIRGEAPTAGTETRARSKVTRSEIDERVPRSAPDALKFEPGVFVQQTSHGQGSPFIRGRHGTRVLILYDGIRLNNSTFRQGPNQYLFTLDTQTIRSIEVIRGGASTLFGTDALGGAIVASSLLPEMPEPGTTFSWEPRARAQYHQADQGTTVRGQVAATVGERFSAIVGGGYVNAELLRSAGSVRNPANGARPEVPRFAADGVTQLGTGYTIATGDITTRYWLSPNVTLIAAANVFRQYDTPRTDQCPPAFGLLGDCTMIEEQFRTLAYAGLDGDLGALARRSRVRLSFQRQHERRVRTRPVSYVENGGRDDVDTIGLSGSFETEEMSLDRAVGLRGHWGGDVYRDSLGSGAWTRFTDSGRVFPYERGQYLEGSSYLTGGAFARGELRVSDRMTIALGGRTAVTRAIAPSDPETTAAAFDRTWLATAAEARSAFRVLPWLTVSGGFDRSFRAPNLDDLTSRQQTGPGFQIDNRTVGPETQMTTEVGVVADVPQLRAELWAFRSVLYDGLDRVARSIGECPAGPSSEACTSSWSRFQVVNAAAPSFVHGVETALRFRPADFFRGQATFTWTHGEGPNLGGAVPWGQFSDPNPRVPLSRIAPTSGTIETRWSFLSFYAGWALRWALAQTRLSVSDRADYRIPNGGTPGFAIFDLRAGYRLRRTLIVNVALENIMNRPYRSHGSGVNGAARSVSVGVEIGL